MIEAHTTLSEPYSLVLRKLKTNRHMLSGRDFDAN